MDDGRLVALSAPRVIDLDQVLDRTQHIQAHRGGREGLHALCGLFSRSRGALPPYEAVTNRVLSLRGHAAQ